MNAKNWAVAGAVLALAALGAPSLASAQATSAHALVTAPVNDNVTVPLPGNTRPEAHAANDRGPVPGDMELDGMLLQLQRSPEDEAAVGRFIDELHDPASPQYQRWLTPSEFGARFGLAEADIGRIVAWLTGHRFTIDRVYESRMTIAFSGTAGQVAEAFHTSIHRLNVGGVMHIANMSDPRIPAALAPAVAGIASLHDFRPQNRRHTRYTGNGNWCGTPQGTTPCHLVAPGDLETIYQFLPAYQAGFTGKGISVAVVEDTDLYANHKDWTSFVKTFGLGTYGGTFSMIHPSCTDPGNDNGSDESEAALDAQWVTAAAPGATVLYISCDGTQTTDGVTQAIVNAVHMANPPPIISISYGVCETQDGAAANRTYYNAYQTAVAAGISVFVATGDNGPSDCAGNQKGAKVGIGINGWGNTIYNVAVGGTDFADTFEYETYGSPNPTRYWKANAGAPWSTAKSYIPETPWNDTCASTILTLDLGNVGEKTYGTNGFCNDAADGGTQYRALGGGEGGPSGCATGSPITGSGGAVGNTCKGYTKPSWQATVYGYINDGVRDVPDVAMFAADGTWGHSLISCFSDPNQSGTSCSANPGNWAGNAGGTSFATPIVAGIQAVVNQSLGLTAKGVGLPNNYYYPLAVTEYGSSTTKAATLATCNSSKGTGPTNAACVFNNVTLGDDDIDCVPDNNGHLYNCYRPSGAFGVLSTSNSAYQPAYLAKAGYNFPSGLGTINVYNLVKAWDQRFPAAPATEASR